MKNPEISPVLTGIKTCGRHVKLQLGQYAIGQSPRDALRYLGVGGIPALGFGFHREISWRSVTEAYIRQASDIDLGDPLQPPLGRLLDILGEYIPVIMQ